MTYSSLISDVQTYLERTNATDPLVTQLPRLVMMAENRIATDARILGTRRVVQGTFAIGDPVIEKPAYWRTTTSLNCTLASGAKSPIFQRTYEFCRAYWPTSSQTGTPRYYADYNFDNFLVVPTPAAALQFELLYIARLEPLSDSNQTNWLTGNAPQLLLAATLLEAELWLKNFRNVDARRGAYNESLSAFKTEDSLRGLDRSVVFAPTA